MHFVIEFWKLKNNDKILWVKRFLVTSVYVCVLTDCICTVHGEENGQYLRSDMCVNQTLFW